MKKCECPEVSKVEDRYLSMYDEINERPFVNHKPHKCKCTNNILPYKRDNKILLLCSCCCLSGDEEMRGN